MIPKISFIAASSKPHAWEKMLSSLKSTKHNYEIVISGSVDPSIVQYILDANPEIKYIKNSGSTICQTYEIARRNAIGEYTCWISDDSIFSEGCIDRLLDKEISYKTIVAIKTILKDSPGDDFDYHRFFSRNLNTPILPLTGVITTKYLNELGGLDCRYSYGKWEMDLGMRVLADGGEINKFIEGDVTKKHVLNNGCNNDYWSGSNEDSEQLENSWVIGGYKDKNWNRPVFALGKDNVPFHMPMISNHEVTLKRNDVFMPFKEENLLTRRQLYRIAK